MGGSQGELAAPLTARVSVSNYVWTWFPERLIFLVGRCRLSAVERRKIGGKTKFVGLGIVGFIALLQVDPCTEPEEGCGLPLVADGVQSCEEWARDREAIEQASAIEVREVAVGEVLAELIARDVELPDALKNRAKSPAPVAQPDSVGEIKAYVLAYAEKSDPEELVEVVLDLGDLPFPELQTLRELDPASRQRVLDDRKELITQEQAALTGRLKQLGVRTAEPVGLLNHLQAWVPPSLMQEVVSHPDVEAVYPAWQPVDLLYDHDEVREATYLSEFWESGIKGESGSNSCDPALGYEDIKIAVVEGCVASLIVPNQLNTLHPGWRDCDGCESRVRAHYFCSENEPGSEGCAPWEGEPQSIAVHGTWVTSIAAGDLTQGQDPNVDDPLMRRKRTGVAPEASILYFTVESTGFVAAAIMEAFILGADVVNLSIAATQCSFAMNANCGGLNEVVRTVTLGGTLVVAAGGNENNENGRCEPSPGCSVCYPALRPEVLAVGNVETSAGVDYDEAEISELSSRGVARVQVGGSAAPYFPDGVDVPLISIAAPGNLCEYFSSDDTYDEESRSGTSFAAPVVSAAAGLIRQEWGAAVRDARMLKSHVLAMGDGTEAQQPQPGIAVGVSNAWGAGRAKFHPFGAMQEPKGMAHRTFTIMEGQQVSFHAADKPDSAFPPGTTQWKMGMYIDSPQIDEIPYVLITYWDTCNTPTMVAADLYPGLDRHAVFEGPAVDGACLEVRVHGYSVPEGGVEVFVTDYHHSGDPSEH